MAVVIRVRPPLVQLPFDLARVAFEETARGAVPLDEPEVLRFLAGVGWRLQRGLTPSRDALTADEVRRAFGVNPRTAGAIVREAHDVSLQAWMEALVLPRMDAAGLDGIVRVSGTLPAPSLVLYPHAGNLLLLVTALARHAREVVVFGARGLPPKGRGAWRRSGPNRWRAARRLAEEDRLPVRWEQDPARLAGWLAGGAAVCAAFDDRAWGRYVPVPFLGRTALLSPEPWELAAAEGVPVIPATIVRERDKSNHVVLGASIAPDLGAYLRDVAEPFLRAHPGHYATWLAECRMRADVDDHPLFPA